MGTDVNLGVATESKVTAGLETDMAVGTETGVNTDVGTDSKSTVDTSRDVGPVAGAEVGVGSAMASGIQLCPNNFANFVVDSRWYQDVPLDPGCVCDDRDFDRRKEVLAEMTTLRVVPSESFILEQHKMM